MRPNIVWIIVDDMSPNFSCYGEKTKLSTPNVDRMAAEGTRFAQAYITAPVPFAVSFGLDHGMYQYDDRITPSSKRTRGIENPFADRCRAGAGSVSGAPVTYLHRKRLDTGQGQEPSQKSIKKGKVASANRLGKTDYNFEWDAAVYNGDDWSDRATINHSSCRFR